MKFATVFLLFAFDMILSSESLMFFKHRYKNFLRNMLKNVPMAASVTSDHFVQKIDHFNPTDIRRWKQLYYREESYYKKGGPVYLWIEGESPASPEWLNSGYWQTHGKQNNAMFFLIEHRFYGSSQPFGDTSTENLRYLTTSQALADLASFIISMNKNHKLPDDTKWIVFGGSYAGNLAAWMRMKYPHLVHGAVASSAPVLAQFDFPEYYDVVSNSLASYSNQCKKDIASANRKLDNMVRTHKGRKEIGKTFKLCTPLRSRQADISHFLSNLAEYFATIVQYDRWELDIEEVCDKMLEKADEIEPVKRYANVIDMLMSRYEEKCINTNFTNFVEYMKKTDVATSSKSFRAWIYQTCSEYGYYQTSRKTNNTFSKHMSIDFVASYCAKIFKSSFDKKFVSNAVHDTNTFYGHLNIDVSRIVFVHGSVDPWHALGILSEKDKKNINVVYIKGGSHCSDMIFPKEEDPDELKTARTKITNLLTEWLKQK